MMMTTLLSLAMATVLGMQEVKRDEKAAAEAALALRKTAEAGFAFTGEVAGTPSKDDGRQEHYKTGGMGFIRSRPLSGTLSGSVAAPFRASARVKSSDGGYELFHEGDRMMERLACRAGAIEAPIDAARQVLFLLDLEQMAKSVETLATGAQAGDEANCRRFDMSLPERAIPVVLKEDDQLDAAFRKSMAPTKTLDVTAWMDKDDGRVHRLRVVFHYRQKNQPAFGITGDIAFDTTLLKHGNGGKEDPR